MRELSGRDALEVVTRRWKSSVCMCASVRAQADVCCAPGGTGKSVGGRKGKGKATDVNSATTKSAMSGPGVSGRGAESFPTADALPLEGRANPQS